MNRVVCHSGGESSALTAIEVARRFGTDHLILLNHDINITVESPDIKRFKQQIADYIGVPITYANMDGWDSKDQFDVVVEAGAFKVKSGTALCTNRLKTAPFEEFLKDEFPDKKVIIYYGFDSNENGRIQRRSSHLALKGFATDFPLAFWKNRTIWATAEIGIAKPSTYALFKHGNCVGCLKAGRQHWYVVYCTRPDIWERGKWAEDEIGYTIIKGVSLIELEPLFERMRCAGIEPTEHIPAPTFWAMVRKRLAIHIEPESEQRQCECVA